MTAALTADTYPLTPLQQGMLLYGLYGKAPGAYVQQMVGTLHEDLQVDLLVQAWLQVLDRHPVLRSSYHADDAAEPYQRVHERVPLPFDRQDWRNVPAPEQAKRLHKFLAEDRRRGFDYTRPPVLRLTLLQMADQDYRLIWSFSHVILDGRSHVIVLKEVFAHYDALRAGREVAVETPRPFRDYLDWLAEQDFTVAEAFWRKTLKGFTSPTPLLSPSAFRPTTAPENDAGHLELRLSPECTAELKALAKQHSLTLNTLFQGAWALLLSRYSGEVDVVFGATRACRRSALDGADAMVGVFINTLPMRARVLPELSLLAFLDELRIKTLAQIPFEHAPLIKVQEWSNIAPGQGLFDTLAVFENYEMNAVLQAEDAGWARRTFHLYQKTNYPLALTGYGGSELTLEMLYDAGRYDEATIARMLGHVKTLLEGMAARPERKLGELSLLTDAERRQLLHDWNDTHAPFPADKLIHQLVEEQVERTPDAVAVIFEGQALTYRQVNARANQIAHHLRKLGVGPNVLVDVLTIRSADMIVALLGVLKAGGAYVPLDPNFPKDRLAFLLEDTQPKVLITQQALLARLPEHTLPVLCMDRDWPRIAGSSETNPPSVNKPEDRAYIIFTSGSTGIPKGVVLQHRAVVNTLDWVNKTFQIGPGEKLLFVTSQCFDLSVYDMFGSLAAGSTIRVATAAELRNPEKLLQTIVDEGITFWDSAPPMLQQLVPFLDQVKAKAAKSSKLRRVFLSGDWIPVPMPDQLRSTFPGVAIISLGGATEAAIWSNYYRIGTVDPKWPSIPYGIPMQNCRYHVLDKALQPVPVGVAAELHIGGICLAEGYHNRAELTAERFIPDPHSKEPGARLYKTGDLARYSPDGNLEFLGRIDFQVKIRGYRIELGEIEAALSQHPAVRECVVAARPDPSGSKILVAYYIVRAGQSVQRAELRSFLNGKLADYMVPSHFVVLDAFPLNTNGKIDRKALPEPEVGSGSHLRAFLAPRDDAERDLAAIWEELFKIKPIGITHNFFEMGGHSFLAALLVARIKEKLGHTVPLGTIFAAPTIQKLAEVIKLKLETGVTRCIVPFQQEGPLPALFLVAGIGGHVFTYHKFARLLGTDQPCYGIKAIGVDGQQEPLQRVEAIADQYLKEILEVRPQGPYILAGYSVGALVAYELAQRLLQRGEAVPLIIVFDKFAPGYPKPLRASRRLMIHAQNFWKAPAAGKLKYLSERWGNLKARILSKLGLGVLNAPELELGDKPAPKGSRLRSLSKLLATAPAVPDEPINEVALKRAWAALDEAQKYYRTTARYPGKILLLRAAQAYQWAATEMNDPLMGWGDFGTGGIEVKTFPCDHIGMFGDQTIEPAAAWVRQEIQKAVGKGPH